MNNPRTIAIVGGIGVLLSGYRIFFGNEAPSPVLATLQWVIFIGAMIGFVGGLYLMTRR